MMNPFGNYFVQMMLDHASTEHKQKIVQSIRGSVIELCNSKNGNRVVQKLFEVVDEMERVIIICVYVLSEVWELKEALEKKLKSDSKWSDFMSNATLHII